MHAKQPTYHLPGLTTTGHAFTVPLNYAAPDGETLTIFAREVVAPTKIDQDLPWLVFFQGGPGFEANRPIENGGWIKRALQEYRVLLLDQRGTGLSTPINRQSLMHMHSSQERAEYLMHFRADNIVRDAELIRKTLLGKKSQWSVLGQSYGGFCIVHYLSAAAGGLREAFITGGLPPLERPADHVYRATYRRVIDKNDLYYARYPEDAELIHDIVAYLGETPVRLPSGDTLTPRRFQQLGLLLGASDGFEQLHYILELASGKSFIERGFSYKFLNDVEQALSFNTNPIFSILHEAIYCQLDASNWAAERMRREFAEFEITPDRHIHFTGEMIYPWMFDDYGELQPLKETAEILAGYEGWPRLYDVAKLRANRVPCAAAIYYNDMYVERTYSEETAQNIRGLKAWITNEYEHNALRADGERVLDRLISMVRGES